MHGGDRLDCPHCDARDTLTPVGREDKRGLRLAECSCCGRTCRVDREGRVVTPDVRDVGGHVIDGP